MSRYFTDTLNASDFTGATLKQDEYVAVATRKGTRKQHYAFGNDQYTDSAGNFFAEFQSSPDSGTTLNAVTGEVRFVVYASDRMDEIKHMGKSVAIGDLYDLANVAAANNTDRQTWDILPPQEFGAGTDEVVALEVRVDNSTNDGEPIYEPGSDYKVPMTRRRN